MDITKLQAYAQALLALLGALYVIVSIIGNIAPATSKFGQFCRKFAADLTKAEQTVAPLAGQAASPGASPAAPTPLNKNLDKQ